MAHFSIAGAPIMLDGFNYVPILATKNTTILFALILIFIAYRIAVRHRKRKPPADDRPSASS